MERTGISRRQFLRTLGLSSAAALLTACSSSRPARTVATPTRRSAAVDVTNLAGARDAQGQYLLPALPYPIDALEPSIDAQTMQLHHDRHHAGYVNNLNAALGNHPEWQAQPLEELLTRLDELPEELRTAVRNHGGGHINHMLYWLTLRPNGGGEPTGALADAITTAFGDFNTFKAHLTDAGMGVFGSGWGWLALDHGGNLQVTSTPNQDNPYMQYQIPLLGIDVWEHAYYLTYQNQRNNYIEAWWNIVDWDAVNRRYLWALDGGQG